MSKKRESKHAYVFLSLFHGGTQSYVCPGILKYAPQTIISLTTMAFVAY